MRIVHIQQYYNENMGYQENILPSYQGKLEHDVIMITSTLSDGHNNDKRKKDPGDQIQENFLLKRISIRGEFKSRFVIFKDLYQLLEEINPDYIYHHSVTAPSIITVCKYKKNNPNVFLAVDNHADLNISGRNNIWKIVYYNSIWKNILKICDHYIDIYYGVTPSRCLFLNEELGINNNKIRLLPIGADTENIRVKLDRKTFLQKFNLNTENLIIVHGGKITPEKQIDRIIEAFIQLEDEDINLVFFGRIDDHKVKKLIEKDDRIINIGWLNREDTLSMLKYSDVGIWNTQHTTLLEDAIAVGLPMIIRYYGSTSHLLDNSGLYLYNGEVREIYDKLSFITKNRDIINIFKKNAKELSEILSYKEIAKESIEYKNSSKPKYIHQKFMQKNYSDDNFKFFRKINRK